MRDDSFGKLFGLIALFVVSFIILNFTGCMSDYSEGDRTGIVTKFSRKGVFFKTWEGEMNLGGMTSSSDGKMVPNVWEFTVEDPALVKKIQELQKLQKPVTLKYTQWLVSPATRSSSGYLITEVSAR